MRTWVPVLIVFCVSLATGMWLNATSWNGRVYVYTGEKRGPSSVPMLKDYSSLDRQALYRNAETQLIGQAQILHEEGEVGIRFGLPLVNREEGGKDFGCQVQGRVGRFDRMEMVFVGVGVSDDGDSAKMTVDSPCHSEHGLDKLDTVWIPFKEIMSKPDHELIFSDETQRFVHVRFAEVPKTWPNSWVLWSVKLYSNANPDDALFLGTELLRHARPKLLSFDL